MVNFENIHSSNIILDWVAYTYVLGISISVSTFVDIDINV